MGSVNSKLEVFAKTVLILIFGVFCITQKINTEPSVMPPLSLNGKEYEIAIVGGSNVLFGVSALEMSGPLGVSVNLGLSNEDGGKQLDYVDWLSQSGIDTHVVIDSPITFWGTKPIHNKQSQIGLLPEKSLLTVLNERFSPQAQAGPKKKNARGDLTQYVCRDRLMPALISTSTLKSNIAAFDYFAQRLLAIQMATHAETAVLRVPPIFVLESTKRRIEPMLKQVISDFRARGIPVLEQQILLVTDKSLFCDTANHPNQIGRALVTADLVHALNKVSRSQIPVRSKSEMDLKDPAG